METTSKLTRTQSSLLRSSPTIRSSIQSLSDINEMTNEDDYDLEEQKFHKPGLNPVRPGLTRFGPVTALAFLSVYTLYIYYQGDDINTSENLLLVLVFIAVVVFIAGKNKGLIQLGFVIVRKMSNEWLKKLGFFRDDNKPVQWFIGDSDKGFKSGVEFENDGDVVREGVEFYSNGDFYEGEFYKGKCNGSGVYNYFVNGRYEGDWIDGKYDGYGIESWARGSRYKGQYRHGSRHGYGVYSFYTGDSYAGEWFNGQSHGTGVQTCSDGSCYVGEFKYGLKHGLGCYHFRNGDRYAGEYFGDKIHGFGVYHFANGHCYEGSWHEGRKQGFGMYTFPNSYSRCGEWNSGSLKTSLPPLTDATLRAVQAARKTAEKAIRLRQVADHINQAVAAANKAATAARVTAVKAVQNRMDGKFCDTDL
ncbi:MORN repeat-containing protein 1-like [Heracleum sosnowskyi]|uniref:MORN repeat-containing protein 1-like n=1 Tax=Heracleum sosnowskyi TaxID=360622 RepID=A0AAD8II79_9APIA|nr:MORN repeat-containing protein 1-like [Heracleum sosnowskyi]